LPCTSSLDHVSACISEHGATYVLVAGQNVYTLSNQKTPEQFAARKVTITGTLDAKGKTVQVDSIGPAQ
jgi:sulfur relay (sulfurtransferase) DsrF/TusC family protein